MSKDKKVVILNAPKSAGKDAAAEFFYDGETFHHKEFKKPLFDIAKAVAQISDEEWDKLYTREFKEVPTERLFGRSPREHMIHTSEVLVKPVYGKDYFGNELVKSLEDGINIVSDGGFFDELVPVIDAVGEENVLIIRIYRNGYTFDGDSRDYLFNTGCCEMSVYNDGTLDEFFAKVGDCIINFNKGEL